MSRMSIIQLGDVHYPALARSASNVDLKDNKVSKDIIAKLQTNPMRSLLSEIHKTCSQLPKAVIAMGDFTDRGDIKGFEDAVKHLAWLARDQSDLGKNPQLYAVPGNHDVNREAAKLMGLEGKFETISMTAKEAGWNSFPVLQPVESILKGDKNEKIHLFLINTTLGSWEGYHLPEVMMKAMETDEIPFGLTPNPNQSFSSFPASEAPEISNSVYDQLDTPFVSGETLTTLSDKIRKIPDNQVVIVVGHHNILPQDLPRVAPYAELLNSGKLRGTLLRTGRNVIYLHGHIHEDRIEIIEDPRIKNSRLISIGAPHLKDGFNALSFYFDQSGYIIGLRVIPWRFMDGEPSLTDSRTERVMIDLTPRGKTRLSKNAAKVLEVVRKEKRVNIQELLDNIAHETTRDEIEENLIELAVAARVEIDHFSTHIDHWIIKYDEV